MGWEFVLLIILGLILGWCTTTGVKSQWVRIADVIFWGPLVIYSGYLLWTTNIWLAMVLIVLGAGTIAYNLKNYLVTGDVR